MIMSKFYTLLAATACATLLAGAATANAAPTNHITVRSNHITVRDHARANIVIVHGAFADGSGWKAVSDILTRDGYKVSIVQPPMTSLEEDVAATKRVLDRQHGPVVLVGHSYGGAVITEAGNDASVVSLVYVAAFAPDQGEVLGGLLQKTPGASKGVAPTKDGFLFMDPAVFDADFAGGVPKAQADFMARSQMPVAGKAFGTPITSPAWKSKPSYGVVATQDRVINPELERAMYKRAHAHVTEIKGSHVVFLTQPLAVAHVIEQAAHEAK
jgi:pimeloyl-ACP methyl ester carboxylesterase